MRNYESRTRWEFRCCDCLKLNEMITREWGIAVEKQSA